MLVCPICQQRIANGKRNTSERGYGAEWQNVCKEALSLYKWCAICKTHEGLTCDHIDPDKQEDLTVNDVVVLCRTHSAIKGRKSWADFLKYLGY